MSGKEKIAATETTEIPQETTQNVGERQVRVRFDDQHMSTHYANVANVGMSRDEVTLLFGTNQTWGAIGDEMVIALSSRIIMTPSVAKNLVETLQRVLKEYDKKASSN